MDILRVLDELLEKTAIVKEDDDEDEAEERTGSQKHRKGGFVKAFEDLKDVVRDIMTKKGSPLETPEDVEAAAKKPESQTTKVPEEPKEEPPVPPQEKPEEKPEEKDEDKKEPEKKPEEEEKELEEAVKVGDIVQYTKNWLRSAGMYTGDVPRAKGKIKRIENLGQTKLAHIEWDKPDVPPKVNVKNLEKTR